MFPMLYMILPLNNEEEKEKVFEQISIQFDKNKDRTMFKLLLTDNIRGVKPVINGCKHNLFLFASTKEFIPKFHIDELYGTGAPIIFFNEKQKESIDMIDRLNKQMKENYNYKEGRITISSVEDLSEIDSVYSLHPKFGICIHNKLRIQIPDIKIDFNIN